MNTGVLHYETNKARHNGLASDSGIAIAAVALSFVTVVAWLHAHPLVLPLLSIILVAASIMIAGFAAWRHRGETTPVTERLHMAGLVIFFGFVAAIMGDPDLAVKSIDAMR
jgi:ABC-type Fe3+-siderophore transport system permease subunit